MALNGSGTEVDPWLITTAADMGVAIRSPAISGFYRMTGDISITTQATGLSAANAAGYLPKVIDGDGFTLFGTITANAVIFAGIHFRHIALKIGVFGSGTRYLGYNMFATDVALYLQAYNSGPFYLNAFTGSATSLLNMEFRRVVLLLRDSPTAPLPTDWIWPGGTTPRISCYTYRPSSNNTGFTHLPQAPSVEQIDLLTDFAFSDAGWWQSGVEPLPAQAEPLALTLQTIASGVSVSRRLWVENERYTRYIGDSDVDGLAQYSVRIRKWSSFTVYASEDFAADELRADKAITSGSWYLPPTNNGYVYQAGSAGRVTSITGVVFNDQAVNIDGVIFTPRPVYTAALSARSSVLRGGAAQTIVLDNAGGGGGGPVLEGDPAYLDGVVEEIHPMLGTVRALANAEVLAFERRGAEYVPMGSAYSNAVGEFRVNTEVYGGGDIFAFAADFPGVLWQAGIELNIGDRVRPTVNNGYVYEVITAGNSGGTEPTWWADTGDGTEGAIGAATAKARPYYQPVGHGPLKMTLVE